jgi:hypothetical protein
VSFSSPSRLALKWRLKFLSLTGYQAATKQDITEQNAADLLIFESIKGPSIGQVEHVGKRPSITRAGGVWQ